MQKVFFKEACVSFSSQSNYINNKKKLLALFQRCIAVYNLKSYTRSKKNYSVEYLHDTISGHFGVDNLAAESIKSCLVRLQLHVAVSNVAN